MEPGIFSLYLFYPDPFAKELNLLVPEQADHIPQYISDPFFKYVDTLVHYLRTVFRP